ncbi:MAG: flippase-like domain-containing protein [Candidatus Marsarchaeota archaeon]|nr:flippase-like domain-containing protein [Candidatus Marsarchaeota archaeon]
MKKSSKKKQASIWYTITHARSMSEAEYKKLVNRVMGFVAVSLVFSIIVFGVIAWLGGANKVVAIIASADLWLFGLAFVFVFFGYILRFIKWSYYLRTLKISVPLRKSFMVYMSLYSMNITPGKIGRVLAAYTLNRLTDVKFTNIIPIVTLDIFTDFLGVAIIAVISAIYFDKLIIYVLIVDIVLVLPFTFLLNDWFFKFLRKLMKKSRFLEMFSLYGDEYFASQSKLNNYKVYGVSIALSVPAAIFNAFALLFSILALGGALHIAGSVFIFSTSQIFGMVSTLPGNIGVTDGALVALIGSSFGLGAAYSSAATIMTRIASLWFGVVVGMLFLFYTFRYWKKKPQKNKSKRKNHTSMSESSLSSE